MSAAPVFISLRFVDGSAVKQQNPRPVEVCMSLIAADSDVVPLNILTHLCHLLFFT